MPITFSQDNTTQSDNTINTSSFYSTIGTPNIKLLSSSGIYNPSDNEIRIFNNSIDSITITNTNNVGIGKTNPSYKLDVNGNIGATNFYGGGANITNVNYNNLTNKPTNFQSDWSSTIINKPTDLVNSNVLTNVLYNYAIDNGLNAVSSNILTNVLSPYVSSNVLTNVLYNNNTTNNNAISSNVFGNIISPYISSNALLGYRYISSDIFNGSSPEKQYPPKAYNSASTETTTTFLGKTGVFYQTITLDSTGITYGSGTYEIYSSTKYLTGYEKCFLFNYVFTENPYAPSWDVNQYTSGTGIYNQSNFIVAGYTGEWVVIKLTEAISLTKFIFSIRINSNPSLTSRSPGLWRCYGSNDGVNFTYIPEASNETNVISTTTYTNNNNSYTHTVSGTVGLYRYIGFTVNRLSGTDIYATMLNFSEIQLFGKSSIDFNVPYSLITSNVLTNVINPYISSNVLTNVINPYISSNALLGYRYISSDAFNGSSPDKQYPPKAFNSSSSEITTTFLGKTGVYYQSFTLDNTNISYGSGTYELYSSSTGGGSLTKEKLFDFSTSETTTSTHFLWANYSAGNYQGSNFIIAGYTGDWIIIKLPESISLSKFNFIARINETDRAPGLWRCYGSNDGITFTTIPDASNESVIATYTNNTYTKTISSTTPLYNYIGFTINKISGSDAVLNFVEIQLFGKGSLDTISPFSLINSNVLTNVLANYNTINTNSISSNVLNNIISFYISSNALLGYKYINSNVLSDVLANYSTNNTNSVSSNVLGDVINSYISSNALLGYKYINSNILSDIINPYISSNVLNNVLYNNVDNNSLSSNIFFSYSEERQYLPVVSTEQRSASYQNTGDFLGKTGVVYQYIDISNDLLNPEIFQYGTGRYNIYTSSVYLSDQIEKLFNFSTADSGGIRWNLTYATNTGLFSTNTTTYLVNDGCIGEWIVLELPEKISLTKINFKNISTNINRAPSKWNTYGSNDGLNWSLISEASNQSTALTTSDYINYEFTKTIVETITPEYKFFGICVNKIIAGLASAVRLQINEIIFFGKMKNLVDNIPFNLINSNVLINHITNYNLTSSFLSTEKRYPPKEYNSTTSETTTTFLNKTVKYQTITLDTTGIDYGSGTYEIYSSSSEATSLNKKDVLFNHNNIDDGTIWVDSQYNDTDGSYLGNNFIVSGYSGDWIIIKLPEVISLSKFTFYIDSFSFNYAPALWKCYGSNDGINFGEIPDGSISSQLITTDYINNYYTKIITSPTPLYSYIGFTFNKIVGGNFANFLSMTEIQLFGKTLLTPLPFNIISSNVLSDVLTPHITSNALLGYKYINSNILTNVLSPYVSSNVFNNVISYYPSSNILTNVLSNYDNNQSSSLISGERQYPPKAFNSTTSETTTNFINKTVFYLTLTLNSSGITYGSGDYIIYSSSRNNDNFYRKDVLFNYDINGYGAIWQSDFYNYTDGSYLGSNGIVNGYNGEWIIIKLPNAISLSKYVFYTEAYSNPTLWKCYGSNDGINFVEIPDASLSSILTNSDYTNNTYTKTISSKTPFYKYIGFTFNKIITTNAGTLSFKEIRLFGKEFLFNDLNPPFNLINSNVISLYPSSNVITNVLSPYISSNVYNNVIANQQINFNNITNKPTYYPANYTDLVNKPTIINSQWTSGTSLIYITNTSVGIGLTNPLLSRALDVNGVIGTNSSVGCSFLQVSANLVSRGGTNANLLTFDNQIYLNNTSFNQTNVCADFGSSIFVQGSVVITSDERIKKNIVDINDDTALQKILSIQPKIYNYIDYKKKGTSNIYGFIAQQIKEVIPEAITLQTNYIPNIYDLGDYSSNIITTSNIDISNIINTSNIVKIIDNYGYEYKCNITSVISSNSFTIDKDINTSNVFIYGKEIDDFHSLDKSYIYTLNVCATQEISRKLDLAIQRIEYLENYINSNI